MVDTPAPQTSPTKAERRAREKARAIRNARRDLSTEAKLWAVALVCGILVGCIMAVMRVAIIQIELFGFGVDDERITSAAGQLPAWRVVLIPILGGAVVAALLYIGLKVGIRGEPRSGGIRDVIDARRHVLQKGGHVTPLSSVHMGWKDGVQTFLLAIVSLGSGASAGREGPAVHVGAVLSGLLAHRLRFNAAQIRALLGCGAAAAVASSFNAPLAGLLFAHEVILGRYRISDIGPIAVASVTGALMTRVFFGTDPVFPKPDITIAPISFFAVTPLLGLLAAGLAIVMIRTWVMAPKIGTNFAAQIKVPVWTLPILAGAVIGLFALAFPQVLGVGYEPTANAMLGGYTAAFMLILAVAKIAATSICIGARFGGGVFSSSIFVGAMVGGFFGALVGIATGDGEAAKIFFTVVGMGAISGAVLGAPISTTLIVFELTQSYETAAATLISVSLATVIVQATEGGGIFEQQLKKG